MYLFELQFCLGICPGVGLMDHMATIFLFYVLNFYLFIYFLVALGLRCCARPSSS